MRIARKILLIMLLAVLPSIAWAQEQISVRTGEHEGYSRIVFDWGTPVSYTVQPQGDTVIVTFDRAATVPSAISARAIQEITIQSTNPLSVAIQTDGSGVRRDFTTGNRVVLDLNASGPIAQESRAAESPAKREEKPAEKVLAVKAPKPDQKELSPADDTVIPDELKEVAERLKLEPEYPHLQVPQQEQASEAQDAEQSDGDNIAATAEVRKQERSDAEKDNADSGANLLTLSTTKAIGLAVYEYAGTLNILTNRPNVAVRPQLSGPNIEYFTPISQMNLDDGKLFVTKTLDSASTRAQGAGLLWNVIVSPRIDERDAVAPVRTGLPKGGSRMRGGYLVWPMKSAAQIIEHKHPQTLENLISVTVDRSDDFSGARLDFVDFDVLKSPVGITIRPKVDDLQVEIVPGGVKISRPAGLALSQDSDLQVARNSKRAVKLPGNPDDRRIYNFAEWEMGGLSALNQNRNLILAGMMEMSDDARVEGLITMGKMNLASGRGAEALGFLNYAAQKVPELVQNPEFLALRAAAKAFDWKTDWALADFNSEILDPYQEIGIWKSFVLADLGDWQQAYDVLPNDLTALRDYPPLIRNRLGTVLAEVYLRAGDLKPAEDIFKLIEEEKDDLNTELDAALQYLKGEYNRQKGDVETTMKLWKPLTEGQDDLYRVKAGLALSRLRVDEGKLKPRQAIDTLERLRYAWRGDELEAQINYWLGRTYFEAGEYIKGMKILRHAATLVPNSLLGRRILGDMQSLFTEFYVGEGLAKVSPLDAVALYEEFTELVPTGAEGNDVVAALAEHLVKTDLLSRAGNLLQHQIDHRLSGEDAMRTAMRLAAIRLIDKKPEMAASALSRARAVMQNLPKNQVSKKKAQDLSLLSVRALSQQGKTDEALDILEELPRDRDVNRLRADIAWQAGYWDDASFALEDVIIDENISLTRPLSDAHAMLILQQATAMNLSGDRIGLANMREKYAELMSQTTKGRLFDVITRPRQNAGLADRDTLLSAVSETDLFEDFLNSYKDVQSPSQ